MAISVIISSAFPFIYYNRRSQFNPSEYIPLAYGSNAYIYGGWGGIVAIGISFILFKFYKTKQAVILSIIGCCLIGFTTKKRRTQKLARMLDVFWGDDRFERELWLRPEAAPRGSWF